MTKKLITWILCFLIVFGLMACTDDTTDTIVTTTSSEPIGLEDGSVVYDAETVASFGSGTPKGTVQYDEEEDQAVIWNIDASLDNYGGIQTPTLSLDFSKAVIFRMEVDSVYSEYIVKLAVEGESEYYYVLSDESRTGTISINVVDAMLSDKYRTRLTQPDPGYADGWKYDGQVKNCNFHILAKGPDGERQTAELVVSEIAVFNDKEAITDVSISHSAIEEGTVSRLKGTESIQLQAEVTPDEAAYQNVIWRSDDPGVATVDESGNVSFVGVGRTEVHAISAIDQSKSASVTIDTLSGYENPEDLKTMLASLDYGGSTSDTLTYSELFKTTWGESIHIVPDMADIDVFEHRMTSTDVTVENYFNPDLSAHINDAENYMSGDDALAPIALDGDVATIYRNINGKLYQVNNSNELAFAFATKSSGNWTRTDAIIEHGIVVYQDGSVRKYTIHVLNATELGDYQPEDFADNDQWVIPDRTRQDEDAVIHALSPAIVRVADDLAYIKQNKYPEAKYCFGGLVSTPFETDAGKPVEFVLDVNMLTRMNDYVITMWEVKVLYYDAGGRTVNTNPLKIKGGNTTGQHVFRFTPAYDTFRLYFVVNGSDIGAQFADAEMAIERFHFYQIDDEETDDNQ